MEGHDDLVNYPIQASGITFVRAKATRSYRADDVRKSIDFYM